MLLFAAVDAVRHPKADRRAGADGGEDATARGMSVRYGTQNSGERASAKTPSLPGHPFSVESNGQSPHSVNSTRGEVLRRRHSDPERPLHPRGAKVDAYGRCLCEPSDGSW